MRLLRHTGVYGLWLHQAKPTSDQSDDRSSFSSLRGGPATRAMDHWCENSVGDGSIFMASGWPGKGHRALLKNSLGARFRPGYGAKYTAFGAFRPDLWSFLARYGLFQQADPFHALG